MFWKISFYCKAAHAPAFDSILEDHVAAVACFETIKPDEWSIEATTITEPDKGFFENLLMPVCEMLTIPLPVLNVERIPETDWLEASRQNFPPRQVGRYYIHSSHTPPSSDRNNINIEINAATAFGSGEHETTGGCLLTLDELACQGKKFHKLLDMGCGSGILAIAMAKTWQQKVLAVDNDPESIRVTEHNNHLNNCTLLVQSLESDGFNHSTIQEFCPYDIIVANILANPLVEMAPALSRSLAPGGTVILSGLLTDQAESVIAAYAKENIILYSRQTNNNWEALLMKKNILPNVLLQISGR